MLSANAGLAWKTSGMSVRKSSLNSLAAATMMAAPFWPKRYTRPSAMLGEEWHSISKSCSQSFLPVFTSKQVSRPGVVN